MYVYIYIIFLLYIFLCICTCIHTYICMYIYIYLYIYIYIYVYECMYIYVYALNGGPHVDLQHGHRGWRQGRSAPTPCEAWGKLGQDEPGIEQWSQSSGSNVIPRPPPPLPLPHAHTLHRLLSTLMRSRTLFSAVKLAPATSA